MGSMELIGAVGLGAIIVKVLDIVWLNRLLYEQQRLTWLRDQRFKAYSEISKELITFGLHLRNQRSPFESFAVATNAMLLTDNAELSQRIDDFIIKVDTMNGLVENSGETQMIEANLLYGELMSEARIIIRELGNDIRQEKRQSLISRQIEKIRNLTWLSTGSRSRSRGPSDG